MAKVNVQSLAIPPRRRITRTYTDDDHPGLEVELTLKRLLIPEMSAANDAANEWYGIHSEIAIGDQQTLLIGKPPVGDLPEGSIYADESFIQNVHLIYAMQAGPLEDRYTVEELLGLFAKCSMLFLRVLQTVAELQQPPAEDDEGNR